MKALTLTIIANMTSNYGETLGNAASVQKVYKNGREYAIRTRESLKNAICVQSGFYDDLKTSLDKTVVQKLVDKEINVANCRALEGGYMSTKKATYIRNSSFYLTDAVAVQPFINEARFHNNLYLATNYAETHKTNGEKNLEKSGLMPYQYEYDKSLKVYSITIDLEKIGVDDNFAVEADNDEKCSRVVALVEAVENLALIVKGNLDNAEPIFVVGGMYKRKTHAFENSVNISGRKLVLPPLQEKLGDNFKCALLRNGQLSNEDEIVRELSPLSMTEFFAQLKEQVKLYYQK